MDSKTFNQLIKLNNDFYLHIGPDFDKTRSREWDDWKMLIKNLTLNLKSVKKPEVLKICDVGCGNGRLYKFLTENLDYKFEYTGFDNNDYLLNVANERYPDAKFIKLDVINSLYKIKQSYDVVFAFGITHHIPSSEFRGKWVEKLLEITKPNGYIILSFWAFEITKTLNPKDYSSYPQLSKININMLQKGDYFMKWKNTDNIRYCNRGFYYEIRDSLVGINGNLKDIILDTKKTSNGSNVYIIINKSV